ncbi:hypothetical protein CBS101457_005635 [Exobasidium rhododendri]|nr:hypothetical protein CBS101457_005635 [Exobasidium rhododendri]
MQVSAEKELFTNSVAYCSAPIAILVTDLSIHFYPTNNTLEFSLSAESIQENLNVSVALNIDAYGISLLNIDIDLCDIASGILCPLPEYQFSGGGVFPVPSTYTAKIPNIAYTVPNLEAVATIQLTDVNNNQVVGCVQATLSNGRSATQSGVLWATVGLALLALFSSLLHSVIAQSVGAAQWRLIDVMMAIQLPAVASLLSLNYPVVFIAYGLNFAWSIGLVDIKSLQTSITHTRNNTGGHDTAIFGQDLIAQTATRFNPLLNGDSSSTNSSTGTISLYNLHSLGTSLKRTLTSSTSFAYVKNQALQRRQLYAPNTGANGALITNSNTVILPIVISNPSNNGGIGTFAERLNIAPANAFLTVLVSIFILLGIFVAALLLVLVIAYVTRLFSSRRSEKGAVNHQVSHWSYRVTQPSHFLGTITLATLGRFLMITFPPFFIFAFYQWNYGDSWVGHLVAAIFTVFYFAFAFVLFFPMIRHARRGEKQDLYYNDTPPARGGVIAKRWGQMAHMYRPRFYWFSIVFLVYSIVAACFITFAQGHGTRQAIGLLVLEVLLFLVLCICRVGRDKKSDFVFILLCFSRIATWAVCVVFIPSANIRTIPRVIVGFVLLVVTGLPIIFLFFLTLWDLFTPFLKSKRHPVPHYNDEQDYEKRGHQYQQNGNGDGMSNITSEGEPTYDTNPQTTLNSDTSNDDSHDQSQQHQIPRKAPSLS